MSGRLESEIARLCAEVKRLRSALAQQTEPVEPITRLFGTLPVHDAQQAEPHQSDQQVADRLARHGIVTCPDCRGIGYDASGQLCACQQNPSF